MGDIQEYGKASLSGMAAIPNYLGAYSFTIWYLPLGEFS